MALEKGISVIDMDIRVVEDATRSVKTDGSYYYKSSDDPTYDIELEYAIHQAQGTAVTLNNGTLKIPNLGTRITSLEANIDRLVPLLKQFSTLTLPGVPPLEPVASLHSMTNQRFKDDIPTRDLINDIVSGLTKELNIAKGNYLNHGDVSVRNIVEDTNSNLNLIDFESVTLANEHHDLTALHYFNARKVFRDTLQELTQHYTNPRVHRHMGRFKVEGLGVNELLEAVNSTGYTLQGRVPLNGGSLLYYYLRSTTYRMGLSGGGPDLIDRALARYFNLNSPELDRLFYLPGKDEVVSEKECYSVYQ